MSTHVMMSAILLEAVGEVVYAMWTANAVMSKLFSVEKYKTWR